MTHEVVNILPGQRGPAGQFWNVFMVCRECLGATVICARDDRGFRPHDLDSDQFFEYFQIVSTAPERPKPAIVEELPDTIRGPWIEAEHSFAESHPGTAAMAYRRVLERSLKAAHPDLKGGLADRIKGLKGSVPDAIIEMANHVRFLGNDGAHDEDDPDMADVADGRDFVRLYLVYTYELPARIDRAVAARAARKLGKAG